MHATESVTLPAAAEVEVLRKTAANAWQYRYPVYPCKNPRRSKHGLLYRLRVAGASTGRLAAGLVLERFTVAAA